MDKNQTFHWIDEDRKANCLEVLLRVKVGEGWSVKIYEDKKDKTLKQLGALFGLWVKEEAQRLGDSEDYIHRKWKAQFLARIYCIEPMTDEQENWTELLAIYQEGDDREKFGRHAKRISLSWAKLPQMKQYMEAIEQHYQAEGRPLTVPDPHWRHFHEQK